MGCDIMFIEKVWKGENSGNLKVGIKSNEVGDFFKK